MRMLLIDPVERSVSEVDVDPNDFRQQGALLGCDTFDGCSFHVGPRRFYVRVDDTGLIDGKSTFLLPELYGGPLAGKALVMELVGPEGYAGPCPFEPGWMESHIRWAA